MERLIAGYRKFRDTYWSQNRDVFEALAATGQTPRAMIVACCDSRVDPSMIFSASPGEIFVLRNVANLVPPYAPDGDYHGTSAALEFAVRILQVKHVIIIGHSQCGGIQKLLSGPSDQPTDFIDTWMTIAAPARERALAAGLPDGAPTQSFCEHENIRISLANLRSFPWVRQRVEAGFLALHGWHFDIETGELTAVAQG